MRAFFGAQRCARASGERQRTLRIEALEDRWLLNGTTEPLRVISTSPALEQGPVGAVAAIDVTFNKPVDLATLQTTDAGLLDYSNPQFAEVGFHGGRFFDSQLVGNLLYVAAERGVQIFDVSDPAQPARVGTYVMNYANKIVVSGNLAFVSDGRDLWILDVSNPVAPMSVGGYSAFEPGVHGIDVVENLVYVAIQEEGMAILDVTDPSSPALLGGYDTVGYTYDVKVVGDRAYLASMASGVQIVDVSNPLAPTLLGEVNTGGITVPALDVVGDWVYLAKGNADSASGLGVVDATDPRAPKLVSDLGVSDISPMLDVRVVDGYAYLAGAGLRIIDVTTPTAPSLVATYATPNQIWGVEVVGHRAYLSNEINGLQILDVAVPAAPIRLGGYATISWPSAVEVSGDVAYVGETSGVRIIDITDPTFPRPLGQYLTSKAAYGLDLVGDFLYVADSESGLLILDVSDPALPVYAGSYDTSGFARTVEVVDDLAYVADSDGLEVVDVSNPAAPALCGRCDTPGTAVAVQVVGNTAYIADGGRDLAVVDVSNPGAPVILGGYRSSTGSEWDYGRDVQVVGHLAYVADSWFGLLVLDISDPANAVLMSSFRTAVQPCAVQVLGGLAFVTDAVRGVEVIDISDPMTPVHVAWCDTPGYATQLQVVGNLVLVADDWGGGLRVLQIGSPTAGVSHVTSNTYRFTFETPLVTDGDYAFWIGPQISDEMGGAMDLDQDGLTGEDSDDAYFVRFTFTDHAPTEISLSNSLANENLLVDFPFGTFSTTDADSPDHFTYSLVAGSGSDDNASFTIDAVGNLRTAESLDYERQTAYSIRVRSTDNAGQWCERVFAISVLDINEPPTSIISVPLEVAENSPAGTVVCNLTPTDPDHNEQLTCTLTANWENMFTLVGDQLVVAEGAQFDYEMISLYCVALRVTDHAGLSYDEGFSVEVRDIEEAPTGLELSLTVVNEGSPTGTVIGTLSTCDPDTGENFVYTLLDSAGGRFKIVGDELLVDNAERVNYEANPLPTIRVRTTDRGGAGLSFDKEFVIPVLDVNDAPQDLTLSGTVVAENAPSGTVVGTVSAFDPDVGDSVTYQLVDSAGGRFMLIDGQLQVGCARLLDYEAATSYTICVRATDRAGQGVSCDQEFVIILTDVHDQASVGLFNPGASSFYLLGENVGGVADYTFGYGNPDAGWQTLVGDWDGNGATGVGLYAPESSTFYLTDEYVSGYARYTFGYGAPDAGWMPLVGDWNGDGKAGVGLYDPHSSTFYLTDTLQGGYAEYTFGYGEPEAGWTPLVGDWDGNGTCGVGLYNPHASTFYLVNSLTGGFAEHTFGYGVPDQGWQPMVGDWDGNGSFGVGLFDPHGSTFYLTSAFVTGFAQYTFGYGEPEGEWIPVVGDWNGDRAAGVGLYDPEASTFYLTNNLASGYAEYTVGFGSPGAGWQPLVGCWTVPTSADETPSEITTLNPTAVDQIDLGSLVALELGRAA
jgi:hypothetical protein